MVEDIPVIPAEMSIFSPEILFDKLTVPCNPITESPIFLSEITQKSVPLTDATETDVWIIKSLFFST